MLNDLDAENRDCPVTSGLKDDTDMVTADLPNKGPAYILRILAGAYVQYDHNDTVILKHEGDAFLLRTSFYKRLENIAQKIRNEELLPNGIHPPYKIEDTLRILFEAGAEIEAETKIDPHKLRVHFMLNDTMGPGFYRVIQPVKWLNHIPGGIIKAEMSTWFSFRLGKAYDVIIAPRLGQPTRVASLKALQDLNKVFLYETDDLLSDIPDWNPVKSRRMATENHFREHAIRMADGIITSTPELKNMIGFPEKTEVCLNGIDPGNWPMRLAKQSNDQVHFLWAGSNTHSEDLKLIVEPIRRLINKFGKRVKFSFIGYIPDEFTTGFRSPTGIRTGVNPAYAGNITYNEGCSVNDWPQHLATVESHVFLAPLVPHRFNESKSELKVIEGWALGNVVIASDIAPYQRAIKDGENGVLVGNNPDLWYNAMRKVVENTQERMKLAMNGLEALKEKYTMNHIVKQYERAILTFARGRVHRPECNEAIAKRMKEMGWD